MFNNLIESTSHAREFKRRGSFLLLTTTTYAVLLAIAGVASIYAYDAHLETQQTELEITYVPLLPEEAPRQPERAPTQPAAGGDHHATQPVRPVLVDSPSNPLNPPDKIGTEASPIPPAPPNTIIGDKIVDPDISIGGTRGLPVGSGSGPIVSVVDPPPPPPAPTPKPTPREVLKISVVLNSKAISLPKPSYPALARQIRLSGTVSVQVLIDETGKVVSAKAISGHAVFVREAERAALEARFSPTIVGETPVKVSGVITYNFVMPQ